jgi:hypothetical protein
VVEISPDKLWAVLAVGFVFLVVAGLVAALFILAIKRKNGADGISSWAMSQNVPLPVSRKTFDRMSSAIAHGLQKPDIEPETLARIESLSRTRPVFVRVYRILLCGAGLAGFALATRLYMDATPGNMLLLPAAIVALLSAGALLSALIPNRTVTGEIDPVDPSLRDRIHVEAQRPPDSAFTLSRSDLDIASRLLAQGQSAEAVARAVVQGWDRLSAAERGALQAMLEEAVRRSRARHDP